ncbi:MAG: CoA activase [Deltaproteobacteria bacterium]|nr:CoA activase [Deltaproteobacteria bacterium]
MSDKEKGFHNRANQYFVGIDAGSISINCIVLNEEKQIVCEYPYRRHLGKIEEHIESIIESLYRDYGKENIRSISFTGSHGKKISETLGTCYEFETISQVAGAVFIKPDVKTVISMGGQDTFLFQIDHFPGGWELEYFNTNGPCAAGTGSFIDQQAQRLATSIYGREADVSQERTDEILTDFISLGLQSKKPASVACRCTVFTKSDMIHLQNKGERLEDIIYGLHVGNARNYMSTIVSNRALKEPIIFIGGLSMNRLQVMAFKEYFPRLIVPRYSTSVGAIGVALQALAEKRKNTIDVNRLNRKVREQITSVPLAPKLELKETIFPERNDLQIRSIPEGCRVYLGLDIGSTTTKYAVINEKREIIHKQYVPTQGKPIEVTQKLLASLKAELGDRIEIAGVSTTGSGRNVVGDFLSADLIIDEITAHARGAVEIDPTVDTIFEIGGQDSKYISIANTYPLDFDMNKVCAAGTGSFLYELANKYGINIVEEFQQIALSSDRPVKLAERCTVFMESDLVTYHQKGIATNDLIAGLCYAIVYNYLNRVVGKRKIGQRIMFLGGPSLNKGVVSAFENVLGRGLIVPLNREVLGAYGAAVSVLEKMRIDNKSYSSFRGLDSVIGDRMKYEERICKADKQCHNQCKLKIYSFDGRRSIWGGECGRYDTIRAFGEKQQNYFELRQKIWETHLIGVYEELRDKPLMHSDGRPTVGMQRSLYGLHATVLWAHFFDRLGFRLVLTPATNQQIAKTGIETMVAETCFPVKVSHGHVSFLVGKTSYIFLPTIIDMATPQPSERGFFCPLVQSNSYMVRAALGLDSSQILAPVIHLKHDVDILANQLSNQIQSKLGVSKRAIKRAFSYALEKQNRFVEDLHRKGREILKRQNPNKPIVVVTGRPYNLYDERLNLRLGQNLAKIGVAALPMDFIDVTSVDLKDFPNMYWGLGAQILRTAKLIQEVPNHFGIHLTNFGCGADSFIEHFYKFIMGSKPYLILELDEHSAVAGVMTRLEAFRNVIENSMQKLAPMLKEGVQIAMES